MNAQIASVQQLFWRACETMLMHHTNPWELDEALVAWGYGLGPCEAQDLVGLDVIMRNWCGDQTSPILARMVAEGRLGKKVSWGFYRYPGGGGTVIDPLIEDLILEEAWFAKRPRVPLEGAALVTRLHELVADDLRSEQQAAVALLHFPVGRWPDAL